MAMPPLRKKGYCLLCKRSAGQCLRETEFCIDCVLELAGKLAREREEVVPARSIAGAMMRNTDARDQLVRLIEHERARIAALPGPRTDTERAADRANLTS